MPTPSKHPSRFESGEEFKPVEFVLTPEMVNYVLIGINDRHPWYVEDSPFGGPVMPPVMIHMACIRLISKHIWGDFVGAIFTKPAGIHYVFDVENVDPVKVGEKVTMKGKVLASYIKRGRRYLDYETELYGEDGRLCIRYLNVHTYMPKEEE